MVFLQGQNTPVSHYCLFAKRKETLVGITDLLIYCVNWSALQGFPQLRKTKSPNDQNYYVSTRV